MVTFTRSPMSVQDWIHMEQLVVTREAIEAYERRTGFVGIGILSPERALCPKGQRWETEDQGGFPQNQNIFHNVRCRGAYAILSLWDISKSESLFDFIGN